MASFVERVVGAARLDVRTYEEVEADAAATPQAMGVVVLAALASGIGAAGAGVSGALGALLVALIGWIVWAALTWVVGTKLLPESETRSDMGELLRTIGFAASPGLVMVLRVVPGLGVPVWFLVSVWQLATTVVAVRQALDYRSTVRAIVVCSIGWVVYRLLSFAYWMTAGITDINLG
jgi:hypothetical protein